MNVTQKHMRLSDENVTSKLMPITWIRSEDIGYSELLAAILLANVLCFVLNCSFSHSNKGNRSTCLVQYPHLLFAPLRGPK